MVLVSRMLHVAALCCSRLVHSATQRDPNHGQVPPIMRAVHSAAPGCSAPDFGCVGVILVPTPTPEAGEVLIRVNGSSCGVTDVVEASPHPWFPLGPARLLGYNVGGMVASVGAAETRLRVGDAVWTMLGGRGDGSGAWAEYVAAPAEGVALLSPSIGVSLLDAATLVGPALTDLFAFKAADGQVAGGCTGDCIGSAPWKTGKNTTAIVVAGSGGTGYVAVQLLKALGVRRVVTAATGTNTIAWVHSLGADIVVDYMEKSALDSVAVRKHKVHVSCQYYNSAMWLHTHAAVRSLRLG